MPELNILYCCNAYSPNFLGGAELVVEKWAKALRSAGHRVTVFAAEGQVQRGAHYELFHDTWNGVPVWRVQTNYEDFAASSANFTTTSTRPPPCSPSSSRC